MLDMLTQLKGCCVVNVIGTSNLNNALDMCFSHVYDGRIKRAFSLSFHCIQHYINIVMSFIYSYDFM